MRQTTTISVCLFALLAGACTNTIPLHGSEVHETSQRVESRTRKVQNPPRQDAPSNKAVITWYAGGETRLSLKSVSQDLLSSVVLSGQTKDKTLMVKVAKDGGKTRSNSIPLTADGSFNVRYLLKDGIGSYTVTLYGSKQKNSLNYQGLGFFSIRANETLPANMPGLELNTKVLEFVDKVMGSTVGSGECWDLAQEALDTNLADWTRPLNFGLPLNPENSVIKAGDIIQFRSLKITEHLSDNSTRFESLGSPDHTAVIYKVLGKKNYTLAHQNVGGKRSVVKSNINLANATGGQYWIYRPVALMIRQK